MDISDTLAPNSDQLDACDLLTGPRIFTVKSVSKGEPEQPVQVHLVEFPRPWRPGKSMRRVLAACWGVDASAWAGRRVELYCDPTVRFGSEAVGGTRVKSLSHIDKQQKISLLVSRGKSAIYTVQPITIHPHLASSAPGDPPVEPNPDHLLRDGEPAFGASTDPTEGGDAAKHGAQQPESAAPRESLRASVNRQIREIQVLEDGGAYLKTWADSVGVAQTSGAIAERFGEAARDLRGLMGSGVAP